MTLIIYIPHALDIIHFKAFGPRALCARGPNVLNCIYPLHLRYD